VQFAIAMNRSDGCAGKESLSKPLRRNVTGRWLDDNQARTHHQLDVASTAMNRRFGMAMREQLWAGAAHDVASNDSSFTILKLASASLIQILLPALREHDHSEGGSKWNYRKFGIFVGLRAAALGQCDHSIPDKSIRLLSLAEPPVIFERVSIRRHIKCAKRETFLTSAVSLEQDGNAACRFPHVDGFPDFRVRDVDEPIKFHVSNPQPNENA
jgi:hypothetical protein